MEGSYNARCPAVKRLLKEAQELHEASEEYFAQPLEDNLFEWHFTVRGPPDTEFDGGIYHGRIIMPPEYPMKPPNIIFFTPNGRFETNKKICLSISGHHPESWQPSWSIRTALLAIIGFMPSPASGTIGALDYTPAERRVLAKKSTEFECTSCDKVKCLLKDRTGDNKDIQNEARDVLKQMTITTKNIDEGSEPNSAKKDSDSLEKSSQSPPADDIETVSTDVKVSSTTDTAALSAPVTNSSTQSASVASNSTPTPTATTTPQVASRLVTPTNSSFSLSLRANNIILSAAALLLLALILRRMLVLDGSIVEDVDDIIM